MAWFEDHLSELGRWIDDRIAGIASALRYRSMRRGPGLGERFREVRHRAEQRIEERIVEPARRVDPALRRKVMLGALCIPVLLLAGIGVRTLIGPPAIERASQAELDLLQTTLERASSPATPQPDLFARYVTPPK